MKAGLSLVLALALLVSCESGEDPLEDRSTSRAGSQTRSPAGPQLPDAGSEEDLYRLPPGIPEGSPGRLIRLQPLPGPEGMNVWRVLYHSRSIDERDIVVSGLIFAPDRPAGAGGRTVVAWGHGSVGLGDGCAPSRFPQALVGQPILSKLVERGFVVAATDYEGLGTPGPHPWLVGISEARGMLDIVRAAGQIPAAAAGKRVVAFGGSQGGGAALFAGELAPDYARELKLSGVIAAAPAAELDLLTLLAEQDLAGISGFVVMGAFGFSAAYPELPLDAILQPEVIAQREQVERLCQDEIDRRFRSFPLSRILKASPGTVDQWAGVITENTPGRRKTPAPVLLVHGDRDRVVPAEISQLLLQRLCGLGVMTERRVYGGIGHAEVIDASEEDVLAWIDDRESGRRPESGQQVQSCS